MLISPKVHFEDWISHSPLEVDLSAARTLLPLLIISLVAVMPVIVSFAINGYMYSKTLKTNMDTTILHKAFVCFFFLSLPYTLHFISYSHRRLASYVVFMYGLPLYYCL